MNPVHNQVDQLNMYLKQLTGRIKCTHLIDLDSSGFKHVHFTRHGLHLNGRGKRKLSFVIRDTLAEILSSNTKADSKVIDADFDFPISTKNEIQLADDPM